MLSNGAAIEQNGEPASERPRPESFEDYRAFLRAMICHLKRTQPEFSYRYFSRVAGFSSPNFLKLVAEGKRNLSLRSVPKFGRGLGLDPREQDIFETLVRLDQSASDAERNEHYLKLRRRSKQPSGQARLEEAFFQLHSTWYALPICALAARPDFKEEPLWISRQLQPQVRPSEVRRALSLIEEVGLLVRDEAGRLRPNEGGFRPGPRIEALAKRNWQRIMLDLAVQSLDKVPEGEGGPFFSGHTVLLSETQRRAVQALLLESRARLNQLLSTPPAEGETVHTYHLGAQLFPLSPG